MQTNRLPPELLRNVLESRVLLFLGPEIDRAAGVDHRARLRRALAQALRQRVGTVDAMELEAFLSRADAAEVAQAARVELGHDELVNIASTTLDNPGALPPRLLFALRALPIDRWLTTSIGSVASRALADFGEDEDDLKVVIPKPGLEDPIPETGKGRVLIKLMGDVSTPESLVLTTDDYEAFFRRRPQLTERLQALLETETPVFIGFNPDDTEFRRLYSLVGARLAENRRRAYALMTGITRFDVQWWARRGLRLLPFDDFAAVEDAVRELARQVRVHRGPGVPVERETPPLSEDGGTATPTLDLDLAQAQLQWAQSTWQFRGADGGATAPWVATPISAQQDHGCLGAERLAAGLAESSPPAHLKGRQTLTIEEVIGAGNRAVFIGPAGSGKTSLMLHLLARFSEDAILGGGRTLCFYLPITYLTAAEFDPEPDLLGRMTAHLTRLVPGESPDRIRQSLERALGEDRALLLLDGLDQLDPEQIPGVRGVLERLRRAFRDANVLISCRSEAWSPDLLPDLPVYSLEPLGEEQMADLATARLGPQGAKQLIGGLQSGFAPWLTQAARNPFFLTLLADRYRASHLPPTGPAALLNAAIDAHLGQLANASPRDMTAWDLRCAAEAIAHQTFNEPDKLLVDAGLIPLIKEALPEVAPGAEPLRPESVLEVLRGDDGLLAGPSVHGTWAFKFQIFQEQLAACHLTRLSEKHRRKAIESHIADRRWRGIWPLAAELVRDGTQLASPLLASTEQGSRAAVPLVVQRSSHLDRRWVEESILGDSEVAGDIAQRITSQLDTADRLALFTATLEADTERAAKGEGRVDARVVWAALYALDAVAREGGPLARQARATLSSWEAPSDASADWPLKTRTIESGIFLHNSGGQPPASRHVYVPTFEMAVTPTPMALWRAYHPTHKFAGDAFTDDSHPAVGLTWHEAAVCARWYGGRLPTNAEWDKAASWSPTAKRRRTYPWGDDWAPTRCNTLETWEGGQGSTTPVDQFKESGASAWGCWDMAGNVLEWTSTHDDTQGERKALRGGSWMASAAFARSDSAVWLDPDERSLAIGFRMAFDRPES